MLFDVLAVQSTESVLRPLWEQFMVWLGSKHPRLSKLIARHSRLVYLLARGLLEAYFLYNHNASFVEYYYGLERQGMTGTSASTAKLVVSVVAVLIGPFVKDRIKDMPVLSLCSPATSFLFFVLYATGWSTGHDIVSSLLGMQLKYREDGEVVGEGGWSPKRLFKPSVAMLMYSLRLLQFVVEQSSTIDGDGGTSKCAPMPLNLKPARPFTADSLRAVKRWNCPVCCQPLLGNNPVSHSSGYVFCERCIQSDTRDDDLVECPVTKARSARKHLRRLHL